MKISMSMGLLITLLNGNKYTAKQLADKFEISVRSVYRYMDELSQSETAKRLGVSQMFVSRMERKLLLKLKEKLQDSM